MDQSTGHLSPASDRENLLRAYITDQAQDIQRLHAQLRTDSVSRGFKAVLSVLISIAMYILFAGCIWLAVVIPTSMPEFRIQMGEGMSFHGGMDSDDFAALMMGVKVVLLVLSLPPLICAVALGRNRRKSRVMGMAFGIVEGMKQKLEKLGGMVRW